MNEKEINLVKKQIESEIQKTKENIADYKETTAPIAPENAIGRLSRMDALNNKSVVEAALRKAEEKLKNLEYLISQVEKADFGKCKRCNKDIPIQRMLFVPQSAFCVHCAV